MPMMVIVMLGIMQLGMLHHARLMTEYAAYRAVRAGIVNSGSCELMEDSALIALLPTLGPVPGVVGRTDTIPTALLMRAVYKKTLNKAKYTPTSLKVVDVKVLNPKKSEISGLFNTYGVWSETSGRQYTEEIDFDDIRDARVVAANLLTIRVTYYYDMRVPLANKFIHGWYMGLEYLGDLRGVQFDNQKAFGGLDESKYLELQGGLRGGDFAEMALLANRPLKPMYVVPLVATYSMRMQSNLMQNQVTGCAL